MRKQMIAFLLLIPAAFFFHFYEYSKRKVLGVEAEFLLLGFLTTIFLVAILTLHIKTTTFILGLVASLGLSLLLAALFIPADPSWFKPFGLYFAIVFIHLIYVLAILLIRIVCLTVSKLYKRE